METFQRNDVIASVVGVFTWKRQRSHFRAIKMVTSNTAMVIDQTEKRTAKAKERTAKAKD